jgi:LPPG:FO 2-phospho-L-lactate transferase
MCDDPVRTWVRSGGRWRTFQEFMIRARGEGPVEGVELRGIEHAHPTAEIVAAIGRARAIVVGPSNPLVSIDPILAVPGMRDLLRDARAPIVAVSPIVGGEILKGPTAAFMAFAGHELSARGVAEHYGELLDGIVADEPVAGPAALHIDTRLSDPQTRAGVAERTLAFADELARG